MDPVALGLRAAIGLAVLAAGIKAGPVVWRFVKATITLAEHIATVPEMSDTLKELQNVVDSHEAVVEVVDRCWETVTSLRNEVSAGHTRIGRELDALTRQLEEHTTVEMDVVTVIARNVDRIDTRLETVVEFVKEARRGDEG